ncbi:MAG: fibronectin type III domain-containing protein [Saprospiraceae bacterium]|nr:fibronectin type III domain-containing protein [Saprospiraceae bacterium]MDW8229674.1 fibronectin type III domain-containing protein [Saprospiraceae bacterium]
MKHSLLGCFIGFLAWSVSAQGPSCQYRLDMFDLFGDGWNNGALLVSNGGQVQSFSLSNTVGNGFDSTVYITIQAGLPIVLAWSAGFFDDEISFVLYDNDGEVVFSASKPKAGILLFLPSARCYTCLRPLNFRAENIWDNRVRLAWTPAAGGSAVANWQVVYGPAGFDPQGSMGQTVSTPQPRVTITGLKPYTEYDAYVRQRCTDDSLSRLRGPLRFRTYRTNDVGVSAILTPQSGCALGTETVTIALRNYGAAPQTLLPFNFSVNGVPAGVPQPQDGFYTGILGKDSTTVIAFETTYDFSKPGEYRIAAWTDLKDDENRSNDTFHLRILNRLELPYFQDFEEWDGAWTVSGEGENPPTWQWGKPGGKVIRRAGSGQRAWVTRLDSTHNNLEVSYLQSPCFDFSGLTRDPVVEFLIQHDTEEGYDGAWLEISTDDGATWTSVGQLDDDIYWYTHLLSPFFEDEAWSGDSEGWRLARHPLTGAAGHSQVRLRFVFQSDLVLAREGVGIDAVRIYEPKARDMAALRVYNAAATTVCGDKNDQVILELANFGYEPIAAYRAAYATPNQPIVVQNVSSTFLAPNTTSLLVFSQPFDSRDANYLLRAWVELSNDAQTYNDSTQTPLRYEALPLPLREDFESGLLPSNWTTDGALTNGHGNLSVVLSANLSSFTPFFTLVTSRYGLIQPGDSLAFDYRITDYNSDGKTATVLAPGTFFEILVSDDCGDSYETLHIINHQNHTPSVVMRTVRLSMAPYVGRSVILRIEGVWSAGDFYFDIDNIRLPSQISVSAPVPAAAEGWTFSLWPNPTTGLTHLRGEGQSAADVRVQVLDAMGRLWEERYLPRAERIAETLHLQAAPPGLYWLRITADEHTFTRKLVKH